jgi:hypothetical protein
MAAPKKITIHTILNDDPFETQEEWVFTLEGDKVKAEAKTKDPFTPSVVDKTGKRLNPDDGMPFWEAVQSLPYSRAVWVQLDDEKPKT